MARFALRYRSTWTRKSWGLPRAIHGEVHVDGLMAPELDQRILGEIAEGTYRNLQLPRRYAGDCVRAVGGGFR